MSLCHPLFTPRLRFRLWTPDDRAAFRRLNRDPGVMAFFPSPLSVRASDALLERFMLHQEQEGFGVWPLLVTDKADGQEEGGSFAGFVGLLRVRFAAPFAPAVEAGWRLLPRYWGRGYATEAARACLAFGFDRLDEQEIVAFTTPANQRSRRVMEKLGMSRHPADDFDHPGLPHDHPLCRHVLYRMPRKRFAALAQMGGERAETTNKTPGMSACRGNVAAKLFSEG